MVNFILREGDRVEINEIQPGNKKVSGYASQVLELRENGNVRISMPFYKGRLIPLNKGVKYDAFFYTSKGLYYSRVELVERYKTGNIYIAEIEPRTELQKYQRRQYYRLEKSIELLYTEIDEQEYETMVTENLIPERISNRDNNMQIIHKGATIDISGGGLRFVGRNRIEPRQKIYIEFNIVCEKRELLYRIPANVITVFELPTDNKSFEHRVEFQNLSREYREMLIRYIFEEERKIRKLQK